MWSYFKDYIKRKKRTKSFMFFSVLVLLSVVTSLSYAVFFISTSKYRASELFISNLIYGISITDEDETATINGKDVTVEANKREIITIKITSLNPINSKYQLAYKTSSSDVNVYYSNKTSWNPQGVIDEDGSTVDEKEIRVVIENNNSSSITVNFDVFGGYSYNDYNAIDVEDNTRISAVYSEQVTLKNAEKFTTVVQNDNSCINSTPCNYGGGSINNYVQYPKDDDKTKNIWRIIGNYEIDGQVVVKMVSETSNTSTYTNAVSTLDTFYNTLEDPSDYILDTDKFLCTGINSCTASSKFSKLGLINVGEYNEIGGSGSYLNKNSSYFTMTEPTTSTVTNITSSGEEDVSFSTSSGVRAVAYVQSDIDVIGGGTASDPYTLEAKTDVNILAYTCEGCTTVPSAFPERTDGYYVTGVDCTNKTVAIWNPITWNLEFQDLNIPTKCTINLEQGSYLYSQILKDNPTRSTRPSFDAIYTTSNNGNTIHYASGENGNTTYYFAGSVTNNYVKFTNEDGSEMWWRIIRINEDNSVRLLYYGTDKEGTGMFPSISQAFNTSRDNPSYVGYEYTADTQHGLGTNSAMKTYLEGWYTSNLSSYDEYISRTAIYCNDRTIGSGTWSTTGSTFYYAGYTRLETNKTPKFACSETADKFTGSTVTGNGELGEKPIGLITADEVAYAGGLYGTNNTSYYISEKATGANSWWTMTPHYWFSSVAYEFGLGGSENTGFLFYGVVNATIGVRPVISLKSCVLWSAGDGTTDNPYEVNINSTCASAEN